MVNVNEAKDSKLPKDPRSCLTLAKLSLPHWAGNLVILLLRSGRPPT
jgi:hypothetical protein